MNAKIWGAVSLICGTSVGAGILAIPSDTAEAGFGFSLVLFVLCWLFSTLAAFYYLEVHLWQKSAEANLLSITEYFFGRKFKFFIWLIYLSLLYSLMSTYLLAGSSWIIQSCQFLIHVSLHQLSGMLGFLALIGLFIFFGIRAVDMVNRWMSLGLLLSFGLILVFTLSRIQPELLNQAPLHLSALPKALPLLITAFGYSIIIPSLSTYFHQDPKPLQKAIWIGSALTLLFYLLWELITLGNIPLLGPNGLQQIAQGLDNGTRVASALIHLSNNPYLATLLTLFALFAVITSFLGVSMALYHSLADGLSLKSRGVAGLLLLALSYIPPIIFLQIYPSGFNQILSWAGALVAFLMGVLPIVMVIKGRYVLKHQGFRVPGGLALMLLGLLFFIAIMLIECYR